MITITQEMIERVNLGALHQYSINPRELYDMVEHPYYKVLVALVHQIHNSKLVEIGTRMGNSALALASNPSNTVITYDIVDWIHGQISLPNLHFKLINILEHPEEIENVIGAKLIFLDVDPHDGIQEDAFIKLLVDHGYSGMVLCDDITCYKFPGLIDWFNKLTLPKYDISEFSPHNGLGLIDFGNNFRYGDI